MRIEKTIINCMESLHNIYFLNEMTDIQSWDIKEEQRRIYSEYTLLRKMLVFYTGIEYRVKDYRDRLDIMYFNKDIVIRELNSK